MPAEEEYDVARPGRPWIAQSQDKGIILLHCQSTVFIVKIRLGIARGMYES